MNEFLNLVDDTSGTVKSVDLTPIYPYF